MALPQRKSSQDVDRTSATHSIPGAEESSPWCIDYGNAIDVMRTDEVRFAVTRGFLDAENKAWRDGRPCWLPIADLPELRTPLPSQVEQSGARRIVRPPPETPIEDDPIPSFTVPLFSVRAAFVGALAVITVVACLAANVSRSSAVRSLGAHLSQELHALRR